MSEALHRVVYRAKRASTSSLLKLSALKGGAFRHGIFFILYPLTPP